MAEISKVDNLVLNLASGLLPEHLNAEEIKMLEVKYGEHWFEELGFTEPEYKKPAR